MSRVRVSLTGKALEAADRILDQTPVESYSELFNFLLRRYEQDFISACNGFLVAQPGQTVPSVPQQTILKATSTVQPGQVVPPVPVVTPTESITLTNREPSNPQEPQPGQVVPPEPQKTARQRLMDFDD